ncbi:MAG TPA: T9SS type A sorting domain-containing protein [Candidatus Kapabacteria bacterium]|nr:T9SS type A sorting domain-containing protein [Candidatus Kapabacteria bacterium]
MKKFVTGLLVLVWAISANAQVFNGPSTVTSGTEILRPTKSLMKSAPNTVFVTHGKFIEPFAAPQDPPADETIGYFNPDDDAANNWLLWRLPDTINDQSGNPQYQRREYGTRYTTTLAQPVLDSVIFRFAAFTLDDATGKGLKVNIRPIFWGAPNGTDLFPFPNPTTKIGSTVNIPTSDVTLDDPSTDQSIELNAYTIKFGTTGTKLRVGTKYVKDFAVMVSVGDSNTINNIAMLSDQTVESNHEAGAAYDTITDRAYYTEYDFNSLKNANIAPSGPMAGSYTLTSSGETLYPNFIMVAFLHDASFSGVDGKPLSGNALGVNFPNPVNEGTEIPFSLAVGAQTTVKVYNALGNLVATAFEGYQGAGAHSVKVNTENFTTGTYYYTINAGGFTATKSMIVAK